MKTWVLAVFILVAATPVLADETAHSSKEKSDYRELVDYFFAAARLGDTEVLKKFIDAGFPVDQRNGKTYTALMVAAYNGQKEATELLLNSGANACLQDKRGNTAIMGAMVKGELGIARMLFGHDCDSALKNKSGLTLEGFAKLFGQDKFLQELKQEG